MQNHGAGFFGVSDQILELLPIQAGQAARRFCPQRDQSLRAKQERRFAKEITHLVLVFEEFLLAAKQLFHHAAAGPRKERRTTAVHPRVSAIRQV